MAQADTSLSQSTFKPISATALHVLARLAAKREVVAQLRAEGRRVTLIPPAEINVKVRAYLEAHREELREQALATAWAIGAKDQRGRMSKWLLMMIGAVESGHVALLHKQITPKPQLKSLSFSTTKWRSEGLALTNYELLSG